MEPVVPQPSFNRISQPSAHSPSAEAEAVVRGVLADKNPINLSETLVKLQHLPPPLRLLFAVHEAASKPSPDSQADQASKPKTATILLTPSMVRLIFSVIEKRLFTAGEQQSLLI